MPDQPTALPTDLAGALVAFQASAPSISKGRTADMGQYSYKYADLSDIWDAIREPLKEHGLAVTQSLTGGSSGFMGVKTTVWHKSGQTFADTVEMDISRRTPQQVGSQVTYFKRYALSALLGLSTEEDDDGAAASRSRPEPAPATPPPAPTELDNALGELSDTCAIYNLDPATVAGEFHAKFKKPPRSATVKQVQDFISGLHDKYSTDSA